ncbi:carboxypeptidase M32 [Caldimonas brevitalea]|uniref:Metal-dependent carboxypeptidase n=1 Tax=Caldimonas brevitalea TaxID=413882 RepID=A0A0G3BJU0_9BURK|nr:carboxypeptidase M32 [Caldimonas brevitalea]AKJ29662.1 peptidase M32 [Caldimonas brevitalea]
MTSAPATPAYDTLVQLHRRLHRFEHLQSIAWWDQASNMPPKGNEARAAALGEMAALLHRMRTAPGLRDDIARAEQEPLDDLQRANLREIRREWQRANALPEALVEAKSLAASKCEHAWRVQRPTEDWPGFLENFRPVLALAREEATLLSQQSGLSRYDTLLDRFEPDMRSATVERLFADVRGWLPGLIEQVTQRQARAAVTQPSGPFPRAQQRALCHEVMQLLGFDFDAGRLDESTHPFSGGVPEDVRLTTRYREDDLLQALMGTIHETGHARYEQNLPRALLGQPVAQARSMGLHESQSLAFEMQLACGRPFAAQLAPLLVRHFGPQPAFEPDNLHRLLTRVQPGLIRVDADEVTYPAHVILRFEIERALIEGEIEAEDIPALWDEKMMTLLGVDTRGNYRDGCLQDVHWPEGMFGYFPCYTLGAMYAAQWFAAIRRATPDLDVRVASGDLAPVFDWLREQIWLQGSRWSADELAVRASGEVLNPAHFRAHLEDRYLGD